MTLCYNPACGDDGRCDIADYDLRLCPAAVKDALAAGIPLSVVMGKTKLRDHFSDTEILRNSGNHERANEIEREELIDAGRGHLVRW